MRPSGLASAGERVLAESHPVGKSHGVCGTAHNGCGWVSSPKSRAWVSCSLPKERWPGRMHCLSQQRWGTGRAPTMATGMEQGRSQSPGSPQRAQAHNCRMGLAIASCRRCGKSCKQDQELPARGKERVGLEDNVMGGKDGRGTAARGS